MLSLAQIAVRNLTRNRRRTLLTLAALAVGVFAVVGVRGFLNGLQASLILGVAEGGQGAIQVHKKGYMASMETSPLNLNMVASDKLLADMEAVAGVKAVSPRINFAGMVNVGDETVFSMINGVDPVRELRVSPRRKASITEGAWMGSAPDSQDALMGMEVAHALKATPGTLGAVLSGDIDGVMNASDIKVTGMVAAGTVGEKKLIIMPLALAQAILRMDNKVTEIGVQVKDIGQVEEVAERLQATLGDEYEVHTWQTYASFAKDVQENQNAALNLITYIFMLIMLMGIANTLLMSVLERVREIGTMMAVGTKRWQILTMFLMEALMLGALGAMLGALLGLGLVSLLGFKTIVLTTPGASLPQVLIPFIQTDFLIRMVALCSVGAAVAALYPAWKASRMRPVEALAAI